MPHLDLSVRTTGEGRAFCESREEVITGWLLSSRHIFGLRVSVVTIMDYWPLIGSGVARLDSHWLMRGCVGAGGAGCGGCGGCLGSLSGLGSDSDPLSLFWLHSWGWKVGLARSGVWSSHRNS